MSDQTHVPYMTTGLFHKFPSRFFGAWDYETALDGPKLEHIGIQHSSLTQLGPYHPMFLIAVGGRGFTREREFDNDDLKQMLRGDIDERPEVLKRRSAAWSARHPELDINMYQPFTPKSANRRASQQQLAVKYDPLQSFLDGEDDNVDFENGMNHQSTAARSKRPLYDSDYQSERDLQGQMGDYDPQTAASTAPMAPTHSPALDFAAKAAQAALARAALDNIPEIRDEEDEGLLDQHYSRNHGHDDTTQSANTANIHDKPGETTRPILPRQYPMLHENTEMNDPNQIVFNTGSMTEFHKTHEVNENDIKEVPELLLTGAELTYKVVKALEDEAIKDDEISYKFKLRHFVDTEFKKSQSDKMARDQGDFTGIERTVTDAVVSYSGDTAADRAKPNPFGPNAVEGVKIDLDNPQHELYGGPLTVQHFLTSMVDTDEGKDIAKAIEEEHREFLGDDIYDEAIKNSPVNNPPVFKYQPANRL